MSRQSAEQDVIASVIRRHRYMARNAGGKTGCRGCRFIAKGFGEQARREQESHVAEKIAEALGERERRRQEALRADCEARALREIEATLDDYVDCTCGHPNADHNDGECPFPGCGCGAVLPPDEDSGYCPDACTWPHDHRFERDGIPWPARGVSPPEQAASS